MSRHGETRAKVVELLDRNPGLSNADIATRLNVSKSHVSHIRVQLNRGQGRRGKRNVTTVTPKRNWLGLITTHVILDKVKQIVRR